MFRRWYRLMFLGLALAGCVAPTVSPTPRTGTRPYEPTRTATPAPSATPVPPTVAPSPTFVPTLEPQPTPDAQAYSRVIHLPILMYHYVEPWPADATTVRQALTVKPEDFAAQMQWLHDNGYSTVSLYDLLYALTLGQPLPEKAVVITFDDGYRTLMDYAVPTMQQSGFTGTVFVITELMDRNFDQYLTWPQAEALYAQGWKIEPHTKTHEELAGRDRDFQLYQMLGSAQTVEAHIHSWPRFFNYPSGKYDDLTLKLAREMNFWGGVSVAVGRTHTLRDIYALKRMRIDGTGTLQNFKDAVQGTWEP